jgi:hypothetical protein
VTDVLIAFIVVAGVAAIMGAAGIVAVRIRRRGRAGPAIAAAMAAYDEGLELRAVSADGARPTSRGSSARSTDATVPPRHLRCAARLARWIPF